jgi:low temperature requirement protein LtrA
MLERIRFRLWWQPPRATNYQPEERRVSFLELFYDLVFVVIIAQLSHTLAEQISLTGIISFAFLFMIVWWAWCNGTMYHDYHGNNDIRTRIFTFLQMFTVVAMAIFAHDAMGEGSVGFALAYAAFHLILTWLWWRTGVYIPSHRSQSQPYSLVFLFTSLLFIGSIFVPAPWRFLLWGLALLIDLMLPLFTFMRVPAAGSEERDSTHIISPSAIERFGLFTIIVLGEVIVGVVNGVSGHPHLSLLVGGTAILGMVIAIGLWWIYFDFISDRPPLARVATSLRWVYLHLPVAMGITAVGASVLNVVENAGESLSSDVRWLLVGAIAAVLVSIGLIMQILTIPQSYRSLYKTGSILTLLAGTLIVMLGMTSIGTIPLLLVLILLLLVPVFYGLLVWIQVFDAREIEI